MGVSVVTLSVCLIIVLFLLPGCISEGSLWVHVRVSGSVVMSNKENHEPLLPKQKIASICCFVGVKESIHSFFADTADPKGSFENVKRA